MTDISTTAPSTDLESQDTLIAALANRSFVYAYLWRAFAAAPDQEFFDLAVKDTTLIECLVLAGEESPVLSEQKAVAAFIREVPNALEIAQRDYVKLFIGPGKLPAPPWESVYATGKDVLFQESTIEVRKAYRSAGYQATGYPHEADDHLAIELGFMQRLSDDSQAACEQNDIERLRLLISQQILFLEEHLCVWLPQFCERLSSDAALMSTNGPYISDKPQYTAFYQDLSALTRDIVAADCAALCELAAFIAQ